MSIFESILTLQHCTAMNSCSAELLMLLWKGRSW